MMRMEDVAVRRWIALVLTSAMVVVIIGVGQVVPNVSPVAAQGRADGDNPENEDRPTPQTAAELALGGTTYWGVVNAAGGFARSRGGVSATRLAVGTYSVVFLDNITRCAFTGTIGLAGSSGTSAPGEITVVGRAGEVRGVFVRTFTSAGVVADRGFHLVVNC
jgi:hypothetical protein